MDFNRILGQAIEKIEENRVVKPLGAITSPSIYPFLIPELVSGYTIKTSERTMLLLAHYYASGKWQLDHVFGVLDRLHKAIGIDSTTSASGHIQGTYFLPGRIQRRIAEVGISNYHELFCIPKTGSTNRECLLVFTERAPAKDLVLLQWFSRPTTILRLGHWNLCNGRRLIVEENMLET